MTAISIAHETIVAMATPPGRGGVGIIRVSGPQALAIALQITHKNKLTPRKAYFVDFYDVTNVQIDHGLLLYFNAPYSFTGEDVIEFQAHGSPQVMDLLIHTCVSLGVRPARPGEFSERAFLNEKIDLTQAEAIADLIAANSRTAARMAVRSLQGEFSQKIEQLANEIIQLRLYVEATIDFSDEDIQHTSQAFVLNKMQILLGALDHITSNAAQGVLIREGLNIIIVGRPNVGKSTLINALAGTEVAIVSDIAGTTRDVLREAILLDDIPLHIIDTAGLRDSPDPVEKEGIRRAWNELKKADCVIHMSDASTGDDDTDLTQQIQQNIAPHTQVLHCYNKADCQIRPGSYDSGDLLLSLKTNEGLDKLRVAIKKIAGHQPEEGLFIARRRHLEALNLTYQFLQEGLSQWKNHGAYELLAEDLRLAHQTLCEITGEYSSDDLLGAIFSRFCIGK